MDYVFVVKPGQFYTSSEALELLRGAKQVVVAACPSVCEAAAGRTVSLLRVQACRWYAAYLVSKGITAVFVDRKKILPRGTIMDWLIGSKSQVWTWDERDGNNDYANYMFAGTPIKFCKSPRFAFDTHISLAQAMSVVKIIDTVDRAQAHYIPPVKEDKPAFDTVSGWSKGNYVWTFADPFVTLDWFFETVVPGYKRGDLYIVGHHLALGTVSTAMILSRPIPRILLEDLIERENAAQTEILIPSGGNLSAMTAVLSAAPHREKLHMLLTGQYVSVETIKYISCLLTVHGVSVADIDALYKYITWYTPAVRGLVIPGLYKPAKFPWGRLLPEYKILLDVYESKTKNGC